jgi:hypothetical protein
MAIKRYIANSDNTISNALKEDLQTRGTGSNMGAADVLEAFYIAGQTSASSGLSSEKSRILIQFDIDKMNEDRTNGLIPASGNVSWYLNMYNAAHAYSLPKDFKMVIKVCSGSWQEGYGLDIDNYTDQTYEGTGSNWIRKGSPGDGNSDWLTEGGDFAESILSPVYTTSFTDGTEDLSVDISNAVEDWMTGGVKASAAVQVHSSATSTNLDDKKFTLVDSQGTTVIFKFDKDVTTEGQGAIGEHKIIGLSGLGSVAAIATKIIASVNNVSELRITATTNDTGTDYFTLSQDDLGLAGNTVGGPGNLVITGSIGTNGLVSSNKFVNGTGIPNYGLGVFLSSSYETGSHSYYTKKFFARSSEYFLKRPNLEARWDSSTKDNTANFVLSSSLATGEDNLNTIYLYNYVRGQLQNIPANSVHADTNVIHVSLYSNSAGNIYDKLALPKGGDVTTVNFLNATGGIYNGPQGAVTGIYTASLAMSHSLDTVYAAWHFNDVVSYHTSSGIDVSTINASNYNPDPDYVTVVDNLKPSYSREEEARFRLFVRSKNWNPNNYTAMQTSLPSEVIEDAYFSLYRTSDEYQVIPFGTGSALSPLAEGSTGAYTRLSYDISGNYFDLDMKLLQTGYEYALKFAYYSNGSYREQKEVFKFKVEE